MKQQRRRHSKHYDGTRTTTRKLGDVLQVVLGRIGAIHQDRPDLIIAAWPNILGAQHAAMTLAESFADGILTVRVKNSTLYSLLAQHERSRLLKKLRQQFPRARIKNICFRMG